MSGADTSIAATALATALVAFIIALGQLLQQYFATADGYRKCQRAVMGGWATKTRLKWRWREFRFETFYTTPEFFMTHGVDRPDQVLIKGDLDSRVATLSPSSGSSPRSVRHNNETVCWVSLLNQLHLSAARNGDCDTPGISLPALTFQERSWDFQVLDVSRPMAVCSVSDIAIMARRLGMRWKDFRPYDGSLKAEGHFQVMTSTNVRSLGILLQYNYTWKEEWLPAYRFGMIRGFKKGKEERYIPSTGSDLLGFGIISGYAAIHIPRFTIGTQDEIVTALSVLDETGKSSASLRGLLREYPGYHLRTGDLVAMTMGMVRLRGRSHVQVPAPSENMYGFSTSSRGRRAFRLCLQQCVTNSSYRMGPQTEIVLSTCQHLSETLKEWDSDNLDSTDGAEYEIPWRMMAAHLDAIHDQYYKLTQWVKSRRGLVYRNVLGAHIRHAIFRENGETSIVSVQHPYPDYEADMEGYFATWPQILADLSNGEDESYEKILFDTWIVMLFRACCWGACHFFVAGERVPSEFYGSQLPVYIG